MLIGAMALWLELCLLHGVPQLAEGRLIDDRAYDSELKSASLDGAPSSSCCSHDGEDC